MLKNKLQDETLTREGYVTIPFLSQDEVNELKDFFYASHPEVPGGMYSTSHSLDFTFRQKMNEKIKSVCHSAMDEVFEDALALGGTFMTKSSGSNGALKPHQDWSIVDEEHFRSYNVWIPLVDVDENNGTIRVLPRSHRFIKNIRGLNIPDSFEAVNEEVLNYLEPLDMQAGEALVYDHQLLHASGLNNTSTPRLVIVYGAMPAKAGMRLFYGNNGNIEIYRCTPEFFFTQNIAAGPGTLPLLQVIPNNNPQVNSKMLAGYAKNGKTVWRKIAALFS